MENLVFRFVDRKEMEEILSKGRKPRGKKISNDVNYKWNEKYKYDFPEIQFENFTPLSQIAVGDLVKTTYHKNRKVQVVSVNDKNIEVDDTSVRFLNEGQFRKIKK